MTYSILVCDPATGYLGGAAATGSLCVGGWVLRGDPRAGMSASQGAAPSTFWGEDVLALMQLGNSATDAVSQVTAADAGRDARQLAAMDTNGQGAAFTGEDNTPEMASTIGANLVAAGNMLRDRGVLKAAIDGFSNADGPIASRLLAALENGERAGGDSRGLKSAAILVIGDDMPPMSLRVDFSENPVRDLKTLLQKTTSDIYSTWLDSVPVLIDRDRR